MTGQAVSTELVGSVSFSRETIDRLQHFTGELQKWTQKINLVSRSSLPDLWNRHIVDSAQVYAASHANSGLWVDMGTGGGFPGFVCAILARSERPNLTFIFVESDHRKSVFLTKMTRELDLQATTVSHRIESLPPFDAAVVSARALAPLDVLIGYAALHLAPSGSALFLKGAQAADEIAAARKRWTFKLDSIPSITDANATLLRIGDIQSV